MAAAAAVAGKLEEAWDEGGSLTSSSQLSSSSSCSAETLWSRHGSLVLIASVQALAMADQQIIPVNMTAVAAELGFSNAERDERLGGDVAIAFFATGAVTSFIAGRLADVLPRVPLIAGLAVVGGCASLANSRIAIFEQLVACRALAGIALGGILPTMYSAVGDLYAPEQRPQVAAFITVMAGAGPLLGQTLAGFLGPAFGWRVPFAILGVMAVALGMLVFWLVAEPPRGEKDRAEDGVTSPAPGMGSLRHLLSTPTVLLVFGQAITGCVPWAVILTFLTDFLAVDGELGVERATLTTLFFSVGCFFGVVVGGHAGKDLYARDPRALPALMAATTFCALLPMLGLLSLPGHAWASAWMYPVLAFISGNLVPVTTVNSKAILLNTSEASARGVAFGILNITDDLGKGLAPAGISRLVGLLGRKAAFMVGASFFAPCAVFCGLMSLTIVADATTLRASGKDTWSPVGGADTVSEDMFCRLEDA